MTPWFLSLTGWATVFFGSWNGRHRTQPCIGNALETKPRRGVAVRMGMFGPSTRYLGPPAGEPAQETAEGLANLLARGCLHSPDVG